MAQMVKIPIFIVCGSKNLLFVFGFRGRKCQDDGLVELNKILMVRPSALGDVCRTVPVLASLRRAYPEARIDWVVQDSFVAAVEHHPALTQVIPFPRMRFARWWRNPAIFREMRRWFRGLSSVGYDAVLDCQGLGRSGFMAWATKARLRIGPAKAREFAWLGYNVRHRIESGMHTVDAMMSLLEPLEIDPVFDMRLYNNPEDHSWWNEERAKREIYEKPYVVLAPTARWASKQWPIERWIELVKPLKTRGFSEIVVLGGPGEEEQVRPMAAAGIDLINLTGQTTIGQTMAVIGGAGLVIANDSAPLHMAVGFDRPCVGLFGPTNPDLVGPYGCLDSVACGDRDAARTANYRDGGRELMEKISGEMVLERADAVLAKTIVQTGCSS